jgi:hypothetical protein
MLRPVDPVPLTIDKALAWRAVGRDDVAARLLRQVCGAVVALANRVLDGELTGETRADVEAAVAAGVALLPEAESDRALLMDVAEELADGVSSPEPDDEAFDKELRSLVDAESADARFNVRFKGRPGGSGIRFTGAQFVDPMTVPPRTLEWRGAAERELIITYEENAACAQISVNLSASVLAEDQEARSMIAYAAVSETGRPWSSTELAADASGSALVGEIALHGRSPDSLIFGVYQVGNADHVRADRIRRGFAMVDRFMIDSWNAARLARAAGSAAGWSEQARDLARGARDELFQLAATVASAIVTAGRDTGLGPSQPSLNALRADRARVAGRLDQVLAYCDALADPSSPLTPATRPLLAETLLLLDGPAEADR